MFNFMKKGVAGVAGGGGGSGSNNSGTGNGSGGAGGGGSGGSIGSSGGLSVIGALSGLDGDEKDRRKKEKKARKEGKQLLLGVGGGSGTSGGHAGSMSAEELLRLDEVRRSLKIRGRRKEKEKLPSGITADYSASFFAQLDVDHRELDRGTEEVLAVANTTTYIDRNGEMVERVSFCSTTTTLQPTSPSSYGGGGDGSVGGSQPPHTPGGTKTNLPPIPPRPPKRGILKGSRSSLTGTGSSGPVDAGLVASPSSSAAMLQLLASPSPSADSLTDTTTTTTNSSFATPPFSLSPVGESQGYEGRIGRVHPFDERVTANGSVTLSLPPINLQALPPPRELVIQRQKGPRNDFGFSLRKAFVLDRPSAGLSMVRPAGGPPQMRAIIFAEPSATGAVRTGLLPGDRLLRVNGQPVEELSRETIIEMIRNSGDSVLVQVQPIAELIELSRRCVSATPHSGAPVEDCNTLKRSASRRFQKVQTGPGAGVTDPTGRHELDPSAVGGRVWLIHRGGFTAAYKQQLSPSTVAMPSHHQAGKVWIRLEATGEELLIDEDDLEVANPATLDLVEDVCQLPHLNESSVLHVLRQRFANNLIHTRAGPVLLIVNPMAPLALYSEKVASMFRGCKAEDDMPPHIFAQAQTAYRAMLETRRDQSLIFLGRSGAGKTTSFKHALYYLTLASRPEVQPAVQRALTVEKVSAIGTILDAFGNERTALNGNATKFTQIFALDFDHSGQIVAGSIQIMPIDRMRPAGGSNRGTAGVPRWSFLAGVDGGALRKELLLEPVAGDASAGGNGTVEQESIDYQRLCQAFRVLNIDQGAVRGIWYVLAAIHHLSQSGAVIVAGRVQFVNPRAAQKAAMLLGIPMEDLLSYVFPETGSGGTSKASLSTATVAEGLTAFTEALYTELFYTLVGLINKSIAAVTPHQTIGSVLLVDVPGFQNPASVGGGTAASTLADLRFNYLHERLQLLFHNAMLVQPRARYAQEMVTVEDSLALMATDSAGSGHSSPAAMVALLDKVPQSHEPRKGLLWMLDEEQLLNPVGMAKGGDSSTVDDFDDDTGVGGANGAPDDRDARFLERLFAAYGDRETRETLLLRASVPTGACDVVLQHLLGTNPVLYSVTSWLREAAAQAHYMPQRALNCLRDSVKPEINGLFVGTLGGAMDSLAFGGGGSSQQLQQQSLRRMSSIRRTYTGTGFPKRNSVIVQVKYTVDCLIDTLRRTGMHFVYCYLPQHNGGTAMAMTGCLFDQQQQQQHHQLTHEMNGRRAEDDIINIPLLRSQLRGSQMLDFARLYRLGFPISVPLGEFVIRFGLLAEGGTTGVGGAGGGANGANGEAATVDNILSNCEVDSSVYRIGTSQVFFRSGVLGALEAKRDDLLSDRVIQLQAHCRGYLARRRLARRRLQELAVKCIQRNVRAFLKVRDWPWWRLLVRVTPLLAVHRTEEQLKAATVELQQVRAKLEKIESERNELKATNHKLEARLSDITSELTEEHSSSNLITERLAAETSERLRLEKEVKEYESKYRHLQESSEKMEMELLCAKSELNCDFDDCSTLGEYDSTGDGADLPLGGGPADGAELAKSYRLRYERVARELEFTKKRLQTQHEHDLEQLVGLKKQLEKKLADAYEEVEEQRQVVAQWKRKAQKMTNEMNDLRMLYEEQNSRNNLLEKRQRKFDAECQTLQDSARQERQAKERMAREKDVLMAEKCKLEQTVSDIRLELELKEEKVTALQQELDEMAFGGGTEEEIAQLKRQKNELDRRCKEQDEELDEMAGQIQLLEQAKLRLEMSLETSRKEARKEAQQRDDEMEEIRGASYKKIKSLECQLEQEHEERTQLLRDKHELERKLASLEDQDRAERAAEEAMVQRLKRDARKYRALLRDAQSQLDRAKGDSASKALVRQLRNQLEDAESARVAALKARQVLEGELQDAQLLFEETQRARNEAEDRATVAQRDRAELQAQIDENEEEMAELMKKYSATVKQLSSEQSLIAEYELRVSELEGEKKSLKEQVVELATRLESVETIGEPSNSMAFKRLELRTKELESRLEFEQATRARIEIQLARHKDSLEKLQGELSQARNREAQAQDALKKGQKTVRELRDELSTLANRDQEGLLKRKELEKRIETAESETASARADLRLALQRIADLQQAMEEEGDSYQSDSDTSDSSSSMDSFHESTVTRKSPSVGSGDHFGTTNGGSSRGSVGSLASSTRDGRKESNNPRIRPSLFGSVRRKKRLHPTIKEEDESYLTDDQAGTESSTSSLPQVSQTPDLLTSLETSQPMREDSKAAADKEHVETVAEACRRMSESNMQREEAAAEKEPHSALSLPPVPSGEQCEFPFDIDTLKSIKEKIHSLNQIIRDESHESSTEIDLVDLKNLKNQIHEFKKAIECSRSRSMDKLVNGGGSALLAPGIITTSASTGSASTGRPLS
ncbi:unconventional myosin-XVIIIa isoform X1 [Anopheles arabiensis]|uniref:unconventional myosin-XVIIIa isoform X1 n=2 Tax=Anopheles arabiensis TaxID=7173 RepID=UPI001AAC9AA1|nr:unconventional myosin-XVIIIa isoform X1 [Anopheles arabiensis]XP_040171245.1 unconventional myosin-XVIIIa isoform X1 [Anopheles arabiensis]XP_040171246.1 unconventional myosin-XVIIIa isoform X1 [Anopheles arabiensis]XP_040171247.1 unconventional myosin-XVIIIa isoform X1 [Anopheles arabiensis]XP_040171249.1 unconventional myosin-XVIIIa isoform X1 [Anopheles arabiensis]